MATFTGDFHRFFTVFKKTFGLCLFVAVHTSFVAVDAQFVIQNPYKSCVFSYVSDTKSHSSQLFLASPSLQCAPTTPAFGHPSSGRRGAACLSVQLLVNSSNQPASPAGPVLRLKL